MLARLLQFTIATLLALTAALFAWHWQAGRPAWALACVAMVLFAHALVLAVEFALLRTTHGDDPAPRASVGQLMHAWAHEAIGAARTFAWRQPFRSRRWPDTAWPLVQAPGAAPRRGVLLVHGFVCNRGLWNAWLERLTAQGTPFVAPNLEPVFGSIDAYLGQIESAVQRLHRSTGLPPVIVAHSMGGLAVRRWLAESARDGGSTLPVARVITLGSPHHGTWLARLAMTRNTRQMRLLSHWLRTLSEREGPGLPAHFTCFYSHADNIVFPPSTATLPGARNVMLPAVAHVHMVDRPEPWAELQRWLRTEADAHPAGPGAMPPPLDAPVPAQRAQPGAGTPG